MTDILQVTDPACCGVRRVDEDGCCVMCGRDFLDPETGEEVGDGTRVPNQAVTDAALDMLEALELLVEIQTKDVSYGRRQLRIANAMAVIANAKGES